MSLEEEKRALSGLLDQMPQVGLDALGGNGSPLFSLDFVIAGAVKRTLSLGYGLQSMVESKNLICSRAIVRMQIDTVSRILGYTYVEDPQKVAKNVIGGRPLNKHKSRENKRLTDGYLIERMTHQYPWVRKVYQSTSGDIHFSEKQFFASVSSMDDEGKGRRIKLEISQFDHKYPESSWIEVVACFYHVTSILKEIFERYGRDKAANNTLQPTLRKRG